MRELTKYLITITVLAGGFYGALHFRHADVPDSRSQVEPAPSFASSRTAPVQPQVCKTQRQAPLAALIDTERMLRPAPEDLAVPVVKSPPSIARQSVVEAPPQLEPTMPLNPKPAAAKKRGKTDAAAMKKGNARPEASAQADSLPEDRQPPDHRDPPSSPDPQATEARAADPPPPVADSFRAKLEPLDGAVAGPAQQDSAAAAEPVAARVAAASAGPPAEAKTHRTRHCIAEGDTLPELAARYLGDRNRYEEIFQANRQVLPDPRLLPIGEEIWIDCPASPPHGPGNAGPPAGKAPNRAKKHAELAPPSRTLVADSELAPIPPEAIPRLR